MRFSASRFMLYADCSLKYKFNYIEGLRVPAKSVHLAYGSAVHKGLEYLNEHLKDGLPHIADICQAYDDCYKKEIASMGIELDDFFGRKLYPHGINTLVKYYETMVDYEVIGTEMEFEVPIIKADGKQLEDHTIYGLVDVIIKRKSDIMIVDYKTAKETYNRFKLNTSLQLAIYAYAFRHLIKEGKINLGRKLQEDYIAYYLLLKDYETLDGEIKMQRKKITNTHLKRMLHIMEQTIKAIDQKIFIPNYNSQCHWCEYKKNCEAFEG